MTYNLFFFRLYLPSILILPLIFSMPYVVYADDGGGKADVGCAFYIVVDGATFTYSGTIPKNRCEELGEIKMGDRTKADEIINKVKEAFSNSSTNRVISKRGDKIFVYYYMDGYFCDILEVKYSEEARDTRIKTDIKTLVKIFSSGFKQYSNLDEDDRPALETSFCRSSRVLQSDHATLNIKISALADVDVEVANISDSILTGNEEKWYLSADMLVTRASQLKYDPDNNTLSESEKPNQFYLGANYSFGDILSDRRPVLDRVVIKFMVDMDKHPGDTWGIGLGYRPKQFDSVTIFVAYTEFDEDQKNGDIIEKGKGKGQGVQLGVSFNLDKALEWIKD